MEKGLFRRFEECEFPLGSGTTTRFDSFRSGLDFEVIQEGKISWREDLKNDTVRYEKNIEIGLTLEVAKVDIRFLATASSSAVSPPSIFLLDSSSLSVTLRWSPSESTSIQPSDWEDSSEELDSMSQPFQAASSFSFSSKISLSWSSSRSFWR